MKIAPPLPREQIHLKPMPVVFSCFSCGEFPTFKQINRQWRLVCPCGNLVIPKSDNRTGAINRWNMLNVLEKDRRL